MKMTAVFFLLPILLFSAAFAFSIDPIQCMNETDRKRSSSPCGEKTKKRHSKESIWGASAALDCLPTFPFFDG